MEGSGHPAVILLCNCHLGLCWNPATCVQQPKGHPPRYSTHVTKIPSMAPTSFSSHPPQVVVPPSPSFSNPKRVIFSVYPAPSQQALWLHLQFHFRLSTYPTWPVASASSWFSFLPSSALFWSPLSNQSDPLNEEIWPYSCSTQTHPWCLLTLKLQRDC